MGVVEYVGVVFIEAVVVFLFLLQWVYFGHFGGGLFLHIIVLL
jgi:hypothetical protein